MRPGAKLRFAEEVSEAVVGRWYFGPRIGLTLKRAPPAGKERERWLDYQTRGYRCVLEVRDGKGRLALRTRKQKRSLALA